MTWTQVNDRTWIRGDSTIIMDNCPRMGGIHYLLYHKGQVTNHRSLAAAQEHGNV